MAEVRQFDWSTTCPPLVVPIADVKELIQNPKKLGASDHNDEDNRFDAITAAKPPRQHADTVRNVSAAQKLFSSAKALASSCSSISRGLSGLKYGRGSEDPLILVGQKRI